MNIGTRSLLFGAHAFWLHPWFVARAWWKLFGFPWDPRLWVAFFVHDLGYWGKSNMDGEEGEAHVIFGARLMQRVFGHPWGQLCLLHSRFWAAKCGTLPSRLCYADKLALTITPWWLYVPMTRITGEIREYRSAAKHRAELDTLHMGSSFRMDVQWYCDLQHFMRAWILKESLEGRCPTQ